MRAVPEALWPLAPRTLATRRMVGPVAGVGEGTGVGLGAGAGVGTGVADGADGAPGIDPPPPQAASSRRERAAIHRMNIWSLSRVNAGGRDAIPSHRTCRNPSR